MKWTFPAQAHNKQISSEADPVEYVGRIYHKKCVLERKQCLADSAAFLTAVYNGKKRSGTAATIRYAQKAGREIICINPKTRLVFKGVPVLEATFWGHF